MTSIRDVARLAGVSPSTVSRVMNGTANVDSDKQQRVLKVIKETGFRPNELARSLYKKSSKIIGVIVPTIQNPFFNQVANAIEEEAFRQGYRITLCNSNDDHKKEIENIRVMSQLNADGMVLMTNNEKVWREVIKCKLPVVVMDRNLKENKEMIHIQSNHYEGGRIATKHLIECGCKYIVNMRGSQLLSSGRQRFQGFMDVCKEHDIPAHYVDCTYNYEDGAKAIVELLEKHPKVDGILASNDIVAIASYKVLHQRGYRVPEDVQLIGFDNINLSWQMTPELTTIEQPTRDMGTLAARLIIDHVSGKEIEKEKVFDVKLIQRETTRQ